MKTYTLFTAPVNGGPFNCQPAREVQLKPEEIMASGSDCSATFPWEPSVGNRNVRLWVIGNQFGPLGAVWADCEQDAFDELCDKGLSGGLIVDDNEENQADDELARLGNAGELHDLTYAWIAPVSFEPARDILLLMALAKAEGANADNLGQI